MRNLGGYTFILRNLPITGIFYRMFIDEAQIYIKSGDGGDGVVAFRREKYVPRGGPAGGDGGHGGSIVFKTDRRLTTLQKFQKKRHFIATNGTKGAGSNKTGADGDSLEIQVPRGTIIRDLNTGQVIADLLDEGQTAIIARGGRGGKGNTHYKSSTNQAPRMAEKGEPGEERWVKLEMQLLADVGIIGVPNAGKSTLLSVISNARPKIAPYPFTTTEPNLGVVIYDDTEIVFADIPGLIEGAHLGIGLGHSFLRHIQRSKVLIHLLDGESTDPLVDFNQINTELVLYNPRLGEKPQLVVMNKVDIPENRHRWARLQNTIEKYEYPTASISAVTHEGIAELLAKISRLLEELPADEPSEDVVVFSLERDDKVFEITREDGAYRISGDRIEKAAAMTYWEYEEAVMRFQKLLEVMGIYQALLDAGISHGDSVRIGDHELDWAD